jgi:hypothetical protein
MAASRLSVHVSRETEHDGDSIGADGPIQRYTHTAGTQPGPPCSFTSERRVRLIERGRSATGPV